MGKHVTTPAGVRMNYVFDEIRIRLRDMPPDHAEAVRQEIVVILTMIKLEAEKWRGVKSRRNLTPYRDGAIIEAVGGDYQSILAVARDMENTEVELVKM